MHWTTIVVPGVPILTYHVVGDCPSAAYRRYTVSRLTFRRQLAWLAAEGYTTVSLDTYVAMRKGIVAAPQRPVILTFDDGFADTVAYVPDALAPCGFTATFFFVMGRLGRSSDWTRERRGFTLPLATAADIRRLAAAGFECGAHSMTHPWLGRLGEVAIAAEMRDSRHLLEDTIGRDVRHFAYPYGSHRDHVVSAAREAGYLTASTTVPRLAAADDPLHRLPRATIRGDRGFLDFVTALRTGALLDEQPNFASRIHAAIAAAAAYLPYVLIP